MLLKGQADPLTWSWEAKQTPWTNPDAACKVAGGEVREGQKERAFRVPAVHSLAAGAAVVKQ